MLPSKRRIKLTDFIRNSQTPTRRFSAYFILYIKKSNRRGLRFVISVPYYLDKRATKRNETRRRIEQIIIKNQKNITGQAEIQVKARKIIGRDNRKGAEIDLEEALINEFS